MPYPTPINGVMLCMGVPVAQSVYFPPPINSPGLPNLIRAAAMTSLLPVTIYRDVVVSYLESASKLTTLPGNITNIQNTLIQMVVSQMTSSIGLSIPNDVITKFSTIPALSQYQTFPEMVVGKMTILAGTLMSGLMTGSSLQTMLTNFMSAHITPIEDRSNPTTMLIVAYMKIFTSFIALAMSIVATLLKFVYDNVQKFPDVIAKFSNPSAFATYIVDQISQGLSPALSSLNVNTDAQIPPLVKMFECLLLAIPSMMVPEGTVSGLFTGIIQQTTSSVTALTTSMAQ